MTDKINSSLEENKPLFERFSAHIGECKYHQKHLAEKQKNKKETELIRYNVSAIGKFSRIDGKTTDTHTTGYALLMNKVKDFAVIDIDFKNPQTDEATRIETINDILELLTDKFGNDYAAVKTTSGGLHIYCNQDITTQIPRDTEILNENDFDEDIKERIEQIKETLRFHDDPDKHDKHDKSDDIDLFTYVESEKDKQSLLMLPGTKAKNHSDTVGKYEFIRGGWNTIIKNKFTDTLKLIFGDDLANAMIQRLQKGTKTQTKSNSQNKSNLEEDPYFLEFIESHFNIDDIEEQPEDAKELDVLLDGLKYLECEVHNDQGNCKFVEKLSAWPLFRIFNTFPDEYKNKAYDKLLSCGRLTQKCEANFEQRRARYEEEDHHEKNFETAIKKFRNILGIHAPKYYNKNIKHRISAEEKHEPNFTDFTKNVGNEVYTSEQEIIEALLKVYRLASRRYAYCLDGEYPLTCWTQEDDKYSEKTLTKLSVEYLNIPNIKNAYQLVLKHKPKFLVEGMKFKSDDEKYLSIFRGLPYLDKEQIDMEPVNKFLNFVRECIAYDADETIAQQKFNFIINWASFLVQRPGKKAQVALVLTGAEGNGKSLFGEIIANIFGKYHSRKDITLEKVLGRFDAGIGNCIVVVVNESDDQTNKQTISSEQFKQLITGSEITKERKGKDAVSSSDVSNFIICSNNLAPVKVSAGNRRFFVCHGNDFYAKYNISTHKKPENVRKFNEVVIPVINAFKEDVAELENTKERLAEWRYNYTQLTKYLLSLNDGKTPLPSQEFFETPEMTETVEIFKSPTELFVNEHIELFERGIFICSDAKRSGNGSAPVKVVGEKESDYIDLPTDFKTNMPISLRTFHSCLGKVLNMTRSKLTSISIDGEKVNGYRYVLNS